MSQEYNNQNETSDKITGQMTSTAEKGAKKGAQAVGRMARKGTRKALSGVGKKAGAMLLKAGAALLKGFLLIINVAWPIILIIVGLMVGFFLIDYFMNESRGPSQEYDYTQSVSENDYSQVLNEYGDPELMSLSEENAFLQIFYENEVESSYWLYYKDGKDIVLDYAGNESLIKPEVVDKYGREDFFKLTAMNLYALEEHLNFNNATTPHTFIQHVPFEEKDGEITGVSLTDDEGRLSIKSHALKQDGVRDDGSYIYKKEYDGNGDPVFTEGLWDYGLAPVYHYEEYEEKIEFRNSITGGEIWDIELQEMRPMTASELHDFVENNQPEAYKQWKRDFDTAEGHSAPNNGADNIELVVEEESRYSWMIKDAVTPMGTIKNEIEQAWQPTGNERAEVHQITMSVPIEKEREVQDTNADGEKLWFDEVTEGRYVRVREPLNSTGAHNNPIYDDPYVRTRYNWNYVPEGFPQIPSSQSGMGNIIEQIPEGWTIEWRTRVTKDHTTRNTGDENIVWTTEIYHELEERTHSVETKGVEWEYIPRYVGEPDTSELSGLDYYYDYFTYYENFVPEDSFDVSPFDVLEEAKEDEVKGIEDGTYGVPPTIEQRREGEGAYSLQNPSIKKPEHPLMKEVRDLQLQHLDASSSASVDLSGIDFASESDSTAVQNASENMDYFVKHGNTYGVDPMMLLAISAHESNGRHYARAGEYQSHGVRRSYDYVGGGYADLSAIGLMQVRPLHGRNPSKPRSVRAFNHDTGSMETFKATAEDLHDVDKNIKFAAMLISNEIRNANHDVLVGIASYHYGARFEQFIRENNLGTWSLENEQAYVDAGNAGTVGFVPNVLKYYLPTEGSPMPWALDENGEKKATQAEGVDLASDEAINVNITDSLTRQRRANTNTVSKGARELQKVFSSPFKTLGKAGVWLLDKVTAVTNFFGWTSDQDTTEYYYIGKPRLKHTDRMQLIHTMMAYEEGLYLSDYEKMTPEDFEERFLESFLYSVRNQENVGLRINPLEFFPDGHQAPVKNVTVSVGFGETLEGNDKFKGIQLEVPGSTKIYAVADGVISEMSKNAVVIDHGNNVKTSYSFIGKVTISDTYEIGDEIKKGTVIGQGASGGSRQVSDNSFVFQLLQGGRAADPTWIVDPSVLASASGSLGIDGSASGIQHPYFGQNYTYTSSYGWRIHPIHGTRKFHAGADLAGIPARTNPPIGSVADGVVYSAQWSNGWGNHVVIHHDGIDLGDGRSLFSLYAHMRSPSPLSPGQRITAGTIVGNEGTTGGSTGDHLHLEFIVGHGSNPYTIRNAGVERNTVDPRPYID